MGKRIAPAATPVGASEVQVKGSDVQGSGRVFFALAKIIVDVIDDELQVSDAHKCAGKKVDMGKRVGRMVANASSKASVVQKKLGDFDNDGRAEDSAQNFISSLLLLSGFV
jgi:hypothetical protein